MTRTTVLAQAKTQRNVAKIFWLEAKYEFLKTLRIPRYTVATLVFPMMFYVLFGLLFGREDVSGISASTYMLTTYGAFGVIGASLFGFGVGVAAERGQGWMRLKRASPMPPLAYFTAKVFMALVFSSIVILGLFALGLMFGGVRLALGIWLQLFFVLLLGTFPFAAMGLMLGYLMGPNSAPAAVNLIYLPLAFFSGLFMPIQFLPKFIQALAPYLPPYHYVQLALGVMGAGEGGAAWSHVAILAGFTTFFLVIAILLFKRDEGKTYG
jgi:ABC-2 type transport system permease protein